MKKIQEFSFKPTEDGKLELQKEEALQTIDKLKTWAESQLSNVKNMSIEELEKLNEDVTVVEKHLDEWNKLEKSDCGKCGGDCGCE